MAGNGAITFLSVTPHQLAPPQHTSRLHFSLATQCHCLPQTPTKVKHGAEGSLSEGQHLHYKHSNFKLQALNIYIQYCIRKIQSYIL